MRKVLCSVLSAACLFSFQAQAQSTFGELIHSCAVLYTIKNNFYNDKGLCFTRPGAKKLFPYNNGPLAKTCIYESSNDLPMSANETRRMKALHAKELELGCQYVRP